MPARIINSLQEAARQARGHHEEVMYRIEEHQEHFWDSDGDLIGNGEVRLNIHAIPIIKRTRCGVWVSWGYNDKKFVNLSKTKQYYCETPELALIAYKARRRKQIAIIEAKLRKARIGLSLADRPPATATEADRGLELPHSEPQVLEPIRSRNW